MPQVFGGLDGIITTFAVVSAVAGAELSADMVTLMGVANLVRCHTVPGRVRLTISCQHTPCIANWSRRMYACACVCVWCIAYTTIGAYTM